MKIKALSYQQPWAELILRGAKTMDLRTWNATHRGPLAIHASKDVDRAACAKWGLVPASLTRGAVVGLVDVEDVVELDASSYKEFEPAHLGGRRFRKPLYGWVLGRPRRLAHPQLAPGHLRFFDVEVQEGALATRKDKGMSMVDTGERGLPFELFVVPAASPGAPGVGYGLSLYQRELNGPKQLRFVYADGPSQGMSKVVEVPGEAVRLIAEDVMASLREAGYRSTELRASRREPFLLPEETGVRLGLLMLAIKPVSKVVRVEAIAAGIRAMPTEEVYYWYSKAAHGAQAARAQRAMRLLLAEEE